MTAPIPRDMGQPLGRLVLIAMLALGVVGMAAVALIPPGPGATGLIGQVVVIHDSMLPPRVAAATPTEDDAPPELLSVVRSELDGQTIDSWLYRSGTDRVTVHRLPGVPETPRNAQRLSLPGLEEPAELFEIGDVTLLTWQIDEGQTLVVAGSIPVPHLKRVARQIMEHGPGPDSVPAPEPRSPAGQAG